jgi:hypothetical protein
MAASLSAADPRFEPQARIRKIARSFIIEYKIE